MINLFTNFTHTIGRGYLTMSSFSADASVFRPKYDEDFPPIERENPEVVQLRRELDKVRHQLVSQNAKIGELEKINPLTTFLLQFSSTAFLLPCFPFFGSRTFKNTKKT